jgi:hypothetical protein
MLGLFVAISFCDMPCGHLPVRYATWLSPTVVHYFSVFDVVVQSNSKTVSCKKVIMCWWKTEL